VAAAFWSADAIACTLTDNCAVLKQSGPVEDLALMEDQRLGILGKAFLAQWPSEQLAQRLEPLRKTSSSDRLL
jgi:hypothetical protein